MNLEIFGNNTFLCPIKATRKYIREKNKRCIRTQDMPFFTLANNSRYTGDTFNKHLADLTEKVTAKSDVVVRSHSLRAGVPSELAKRGADPVQIQGVGQWQSDAWKDYCKLGRSKQMNITNQLCSSIV